MNQLFRPEAHASRLDRLEGDLSLAPPTSWQGVGYLFLAVIVTVAVFLSAGSYAQVVTTIGVISPDKGLSAALPARPGVVRQVMVTEGQAVRRGQPLALIESDQFLESGKSVADQSKSTSLEERASIARQIERVRLAAAAEGRRFQAQAQGLRAEIASLEQQIRIQQTLIASASDDLVRYTEGAAKGFISRRDLDARRDALLVRQQNLQQLQQLHAAKHSALQESAQSVSQATALGGSQVEALSASQAGLAQKLVGIESSRNYLLLSPVDGIATSVTARIGQPAMTNVPLLSVVPRAARLQAELAVPASAIGFVEVGQEVRLSVDAFPYQQFGTVSAKIVSVAAAPLPRAEGGPPAAPAFLVIASLARPDVSAFGKPRPLLSGMTVSARITTRRQSLLEWLFQPIFAIGSR